MLVARGLGGCGIHNAMLYIRCTESDIGSWNVSGWDWPEVLQAYRGLEDYSVGTATDTQPAPSSPPLSSASRVWYHGYAGTGLADHGQEKPPPRIATSRPPPDRDPLSQAFLQASLAAGMRFTNDFNTPNERRDVAGYFDFNIRDGVRDSAAKVMLGDVIADSLATDNRLSSSSCDPMSRLDKVACPQFTLLLDSEVTRVIFEGGKGLTRAVGVEFRNRHRPQDTSRAYLHPRLGDSLGGTRGDVVLTAGALMTPKLLLLSGIGPAEELVRNNISLVVDSPMVGRNVQDHPAVKVTFSPRNQSFAGVYPHS